MKILNKSQNAALQYKTVAFQNIKDLLILGELKSEDVKKSVKKLPALNLVEVHFEYMYEGVLNCANIVMAERGRIVAEQIYKM